MPHTQTRAELLDSSLRYDSMRDGEHALPTGTLNTQVPYTGKIPHIGLHHLAPEREMFYLRTQPHLFPAYVVAVKTNARTRRAESLDLYDWDCHKCSTAVMTEDITDKCPNCLL